MRLRAAAVVAAWLLVVVGAAASSAAPGAPGEPAPQSSLTGTLYVDHGDDFDRDGGGAYDPGTDHLLPDLHYILDTGTEQLLLEFDGNPPPATTGSKVTVTGERRGNSFKVHAMKEEAAAGGKGGGGGGGRPKPPPPTYIGARDVIVIAFNFTSDPTIPFTTAQIRDAGFTGARSVAAYYKETSFDQTTLKGKLDGTASDPDVLTGDVTNWLTINESTSACNYSKWATAAQSAATAAGWDLSGYEHIVHLFPRQATCQWSGLGQLGGSQSWLNGTIAVGTFAHEIGHNVTLYHARSLSCSNGEVGVVAGGSCTYSEYGDPFDVMGRSSNQRHLNVRNKAHLAWIPTANQTAATSGQTYTLRSMETAGAGIQLLQIPRGRSDYLYIEYRTPFGFDSFAATDDAVTGVMVRSGPSVATNGHSYLLDTDPYTTTFADAALQAGEAFVDPVGGIYVETVSSNPDGTATVLVRTGYANAAPAVSAGGSHTPLLPGVPHVHDGATATDGDKNLASYLWSFASCPGTCPTLASPSGALSGGSASIPAATFVPTDVGTYRLQLTVWDTSGAKTVTYVEERAGL